MSCAIYCHSTRRSPARINDSGRKRSTSTVAVGAFSRRDIFFSMISISLIPPVLAEVVEDEVEGSTNKLLQKNEVLSYDEQNTGKSANLAPNVPVAKMDDKYVRSTLDLSELIFKYCELDVYTTERQKCIQDIKSKGNAWVSRYARGGSARKKSARKFYIVVDAVLGHLASNGLAPLPPVKQKTILKDINLTKDLISQGL